MRVAAVVLTASALLGVITGCSSPAPASPPRLSPPIPGAPIDLTEFAKAPCGLIGPEQLTRYYVTTPGILEQGAAAPTCTWTPNDTRSLSYWASVDVSSGGLETLYQRRSTIPAFEPTDVHSYPAVHTDHDGTPPGQCTVNVGVAGDTLLIVTMKVSDAKVAPSGDPCAEADRFAGSMIGYQGHLAP